MTTLERFLSLAMPVCEQCYDDRMREDPKRSTLAPARASDPEPETCGRCGRSTRSGIYVQKFEL